jgi:hypothetical protein
VYYNRDGNVPASSIQKYLMQKLSLPSESEVRVQMCHMHYVMRTDRGTRRIGKHVELDNLRNYNNDRGGPGRSRRDEAPLNAAPTRQG